MLPLLRPQVQTKCPLLVFPLYVQVILSPNSQVSLNKSRYCICLFAILPLEKNKNKKTVLTKTTLQCNFSIWENSVYFLIALWCWRWREFISSPTEKKTVLPTVWQTLFWVGNDFLSQPCLERTWRGSMRKKFSKIFLGARDSLVF